LGEIDKNDSKYGILNAKTKCKMSERSDAGQITKAETLQFGISAFDSSYYTFI